MATRQPTISVDTKKKELVGDFHNGGREWCPKGEPELVRTHDFKDKQLGKAIPYGIYDLADNTGWVNVAKESSWKNGSTVGSRYPHTTVWAIRSATVGTPSILREPSRFGISTARTGGGK